MTKLSPSAIIFDLGSTLIEYEAVPWDELNSICIARAHAFLLAEGINLPSEEEFIRQFETAKAGYRKVASEQLIEWDVIQLAREFFKMAGIDGNSNLADRFFDAYYEPVEERLYLYDDTLATLSHLKPRYTRIGLISNTVFPERAHRGELRRFGIEPFLDFAIFSSTFKRRKPHPDIFLEACRLADARPEQCVYVGDRYVEDIVGPTRIGMPAILKVKAGREYPSDMPADTRRINTLSELFKHLEN